MSQSSVITLGEHIEERERVARSARLVRLVCLSIGALCVFLAGALLQPVINRQREDLELVYNEYRFKDIPPSVSLPSPMLATFRGVIIHLLWPRAEELKQEAKYYELQQLSDWICNLMPRFPKAWEYSAWNMAYNISVGTYSARERWHWVYAGVELLRDRGLVYNPRTINLYKELSWIYLHKMGDFMDDHHWNYKCMWAVMMERVLGQPPPEGRTEEVIAQFRKVATAYTELSRIGAPANPDTLTRYIETNPYHESMGLFIERLGELNVEPDAHFLELVARHDRRELGLESFVVDTALGSAAHQAFVKKFNELLADEKLAPARDLLLAAIRAHVLSSEYKLDPTLMLEMMEKHGPLDWRSVYSQGYYWASVGSQNCQGTIGMNENVEMNTDRYIQFGLKDSFERNRLIFEPNFDEPFKSYIQLLPDIRFIDVLHELYLEQAKKHVEKGQEERYFAEGPAGRLFAPGHVNFLHSAIRQLYLEGELEKAQDYYDYCRENYTERDGTIKELYLVPLQEFVLKDLMEDLESFKRAPLIIDSLAQQAFVNLAHYRPRTARHQLALSQAALERFMEDKRLDRTDRRKLPPWEEYVSGSFQRFILQAPLPLYLRARAYHLMDNDVQLRIYRDIEQPVAELCAKNEPPLDPAKAFPPPVGLEEYERTHGTDKPTEESNPLDFKDVDISEGQKR